MEAGASAVVRPPARLLGGGGVLWQTLRDTWDKLGIVVAMSLTGTLALTLALSLARILPHSFPPALSLALGGLAGVALFAFPLGGAFQMAHQIATREEVSYGHFLNASRRYYRPAFLLLAIDLLALFGLGANLWFYLRVGGLFGLLAMLLCLYMLLFCGLMMLVHFPLLIAQEEGTFDEPNRPARRGALPVLRRALFLTLGRPFYAMALGAIVLPVTLLCLFTGVLMALFWLGLTALILTHSTRALLIQFAILPAPPPEEAIIPDEQFRIKIQRTSSASSTIEAMNEPGENEQK